MKIIQNTLKIQKKISNVSKKNWVGPKKAGSVGLTETRHFLALLVCNVCLRAKTYKKMLNPYKPQLYNLKRCL